VDRQPGFCQCRSGNPARDDYRIIDHRWGIGCGAIDPMGLAQGTFYGTRGTRTRARASACRATVQKAVVGRDYRIIAWRRAASIDPLHTAPTLGAGK
jgi:hypothetical protein